MRAVFNAEARASGALRAGEGVGGLWARGPGHLRPRFFLATGLGDFGFSAYDRIHPQRVVCGGNSPPTTLFQVEILEFTQTQGVLRIGVA